MTPGSVEQGKDKRPKYELKEEAQKTKEVHAQQRAQHFTCALGLRTQLTRSAKQIFRCTIDFALILTNVFCISFCIFTFENANGISAMLKLWETFCVNWLEMQHC